LSTVDQAIVEAIIKRFSDLRNRGFDAFESEEAVKQGIILPTLQALGWNVFNTDEVSPEYSSGKGRVDYALLLKSNPAVFIEAKRVGASLSDDHQEQLLSYAFHEGVKLALLTNGITWEFYLPLTSGVWSGRKVYSIDLEQQDIQEASLIITNLLAKATVRTGEAERYAKELHRSRQRKEKISEAMPEAWKRLIEEPNELLIELIAEETEAVCGFKPDSSQVGKFLRNEIKVLEERKAVSGLSVKSPQPVEGQERTHHVKGGITQRELEPFILAALLELGGSANNRNVKQHVHQKVESLLAKVDYSKDRSGRVRWSYYCDWARNSLAERGLIKRNSPRGIWELTEKGTREAQRTVDRPNRN